MEQGIGASRGGRTTKVHVITDEAGRPLHYRVTDGKQHDIRAAKEMLEQVEPGPFAADRAYDADAYREGLEQKGATPVIPAKKNRKVHIEHDVELYKKRNVVERCFSWMKHQRRFATRYDKLKQNYAVFVVLSCCIIWLRNPAS